MENNQENKPTTAIIKIYALKEAFDGAFLALKTAEVAIVAVEYMRGRYTAIDMKGDATSVNSALSAMRAFFRARNVAFDVSLV